MTTAYLDVLSASGGAVTGTAVAIPAEQDNFRHGRRTCTAYCYGTFGSATVKLQASPNDGTTWFDITNASWTSQGYLTFDIAATHFRGVTSGGTNSSINLKVLL